MAFGLRLMLIAFSVTTLDGIFSGLDVDGTILSAFRAGGIFFGLGLLLGEIARRVIEEHVETQLASLTVESTNLAASTTDT